ncbi:MAG: transposase [Bacteroidales bacterium]|nr:transposase [Bacteroidales bacterium]
MKYNPNIHHRRSIRLKGYDYSKAGLYFITICVQNQECLYGHMGKDKMILNNAGRMVEKWYYELENKYPDKKCHEMVVMPNHFHCIIENVEMDANPTDVNPIRGRSQYGPNNQKYNATIGDAMDWFKTMTTNEYIRSVKKYNWKRFEKKLWQRNYWEHIIRNDTEYNYITNYIIENPQKWIDDKLNPENYD